MGTGYPICIYGFFMLHDNILKSVGLNFKSSKDTKSRNTPGAYYHRSASFGDREVYLISHGEYHPPFQSNTWVEGTHCQTPAEKHSAWYWYLPGSGIWIYSGKTKTYPTRQDAYKDILGTSKCDDFE